ncbi:MAG: tetratricopeptide repeat protein [Pseudomonadota bacterium]
MMTLRGTDETATALGQLLGVRYLLEGAVRQSGESLRINVRLIDAEQDDQVWSNRYVGTLAQLFETEMQVARDTLTVMRHALTEEERSVLVPRSAASLPVWQCVQQARTEAFRWHREAIDRAIVLLEEGIERYGEDPELLAALGRAWLQYREAGIDPTEEPLARARDCLTRIQAIAGDSFRGALLRGWIGYAEGRVEVAVRALSEAVVRYPNNPDALALLVNCYLITGRVSLARPLIDRLLMIDPLTPLNRCMPGYAELLEGHPERAVQPYRDMVSLDPGNPIGRLFLCWVLILNDRQDEAATTLGGFPPPLLETPPGRLARFLVAAAAGAADETLLTSDVRAFAGASDFFHRLMAHGFTLAGDSDAAVDALTHAVDQGFINHPYLAQHDPILRRLDGHAAFETLLARVHERWEAFLA